jgi:spore coat protein U-like protein
MEVAFVRASTSIAPLAFCLALVVGSSSAEDVTGDVTITQTIANQCTLAVSDIGGAESGALDGDSSGYSSSALSVTCNDGTTYSIVPGEGANYGAATDRAAYRAMADGQGNYLPYALFQNEGLTTAWDTDSAIEGTGTGIAQSIGVGYKSYDLNLAPAGDYSDTFTATLTYN